MKHVPSLLPGSSQPRIQASRAAWARNDFPAAIQLLEEAGRLAPADTDILLVLGQYHGLRYDYVAAERCFEKALRLASNKARMLAAIVAHCQFSDHRLSGHYLKLAVEEPDMAPIVFVKLAELHEHLGRLPEASGLIDRVLRRLPQFPAALLVRARLERLAGRLESAGQILRAVLERPIELPWIRVQCWYELAAVLDRQSRYDDAMDAVLKAKSLSLPPSASGITPELSELRRQIQAMESHCSSATLRRWSADSVHFGSPKRLALLCGYARSGTTLLEQVLDAHPDITSLEETKIFPTDALAPIKRGLPSLNRLPDALDAAGVQLLAQSRSDYFQAVDLYLGQPALQRLVLDKNPMFTCMIPAFLRIFPETKFLVALRDPRDVVLSRFMQALEPSPFNSVFNSLEGTADDYAILMHFWLTLKPMLTGRFLEVRYEDMVADLEGVARRTLDFLDVPWDERVLGFDAHARQKLVRSPTYADVTRPVYKRALGRWRNYRKYLEPHLPKLEPFLKAFGYE